jgi:peptide-methionine (S)-S-oxide reductase
VVGYSGSHDPSSKNPTYESVQDFAEAIRVTFDPNVVSYEDLLAMFFAFHSPGPPSLTGTQYRSAIFYHSEEQRSQAEAKLASKGPQLNRCVALERSGDFYQAEEYHQVKC